MPIPFARLTLSLACLCSAIFMPAMPVQAADQLAYKRPFNLAPSADLHYAVKATYSGIPISGVALIKWQNAKGKYSVVAETRAQLLGKVLESKSEGGIDEFGLAPALFAETRLRKSPTATRFDRAAQTISFSDTAQRYSILGGEQDRTSIIWQLVAVARAAPAKFVTGSAWAFFVAGPHDADRWVFKVLEKTTVRTALGTVASLHIVRTSPDSKTNSKDQQVHLWLAPSLEWYPVRVRSIDADGNLIEQTLEKITKNNL